MHFLLVQGDLLHGDCLLVDGDPVLVQGDRGFVLADLSADVGRLVWGDRLAGDVDLFAGNRHLDRLCVGHDVLAEPSLARLYAVLVDVELLFRAHDAAVVVGTGGGLTGALVAGDAQLVGGVPSGIRAVVRAGCGSGSCTCGANSRGANSRGTEPCFAGARVGTAATRDVSRIQALAGAIGLDVLRGIKVVVGVDAVLFVGREPLLGVDRRCVLDPILAEGELQAVAF